VPRCDSSRAPEATAPGAGVPGARFLSGTGGPPFPGNYPTIGLVELVRSRSAATLQRLTDMVKML